MKLTEEQRIQMYNLNFEQLYNDAYKYYNKNKITFTELLNYYLTLDNHIDVTYNILYHYYLKSKQIGYNRYKYEQKEAYKGHNKVILYYLKKLELENDSDKYNDESLNET